MSSNAKRLIAVVGATGQQGGGVVRALKASGEFTVRALTRNPDKHRQLADEVVNADLDRPETLRPAFKGAYGVFLVTDAREKGTGELKQATAAVRAAKDAGVKHFVWSTLPDVETISGGKFDVPHFTGKAKIDRVVKEAGFPHHTFVIAPGYYQNFVGVLAPHKQPDGSVGWALPLDPDVRCLHMGDIRELGDIVAGAFARPDEAGNGAYLPLVGDFLSFNEIVETLNRQGHKLSYNRIPKETFAGSFPGAGGLAEMFGYWEAHTYLGSDSFDRIALANKIAGRRPTKFSEWAQANLPVQTPAKNIEPEQAGSRAVTRPDGERRDAGAAAGAVARVTPERIRARAYEIFLARHGGEGDALADWLRAERELHGSGLPAEKASTDVKGRQRAGGGGADGGRRHS